MRRVVVVMAAAAVALTGCGGKQQQRSVAAKPAAPATRQLGSGSLRCVNPAHPHERLCMFAASAGETKVRIVGPAGMKPMKEPFFTGAAVGDRKYTVAAAGRDAVVQVPRLKAGILIVGATLNDGGSRVAHLTVTP
jgi:hypothetical protein